MTPSSRLWLRGFGMLEVLISGTMLVLGLAAVLSFASSTSGVAAHQRHITQGAHIAELQMEKLLLLPPDHTRLTNGVHVGPRYDDVGTPSASGDYHTTWSVAVDAAIPGTRTMTVTVTWTEATGTRSTTLTTIRS
jgi:Tfp pilus assembly protein PilV